MSFKGVLESEKDKYVFNQSKLFALMIRCPFDSPGDNCPLEEYRVGDDLEGKYLFIESLDEGEKFHLLTLHNRCFELRMGSFLHLNHATITNTEKGIIATSLSDIRPSRSLSGLKKNNLKEKRCNI